MDLAQIKLHHYSVGVEWTGNVGMGTSHYQSYQRDHIISVAQKVDIKGSSDVCFRGNATKHNPEELLVASIASCHMLWYLHLCAQEGIIVTHYFDNAHGTMKETNGGGGHFTEVVLKPSVTVTKDSMVKSAFRLHQEAHKLCFIANSLNFPITHLVEVKAVQL
jgi:organic hydroperoxide reductase OsmC/OhrA